MAGKKILDCIIVATDCPLDDVVDSDGNENEVDDPPTRRTQETDVVKPFNQAADPDALPQTPSPNARSSQSPKETCKAGTRQSHVCNYSLEEHGLNCGDLPEKALGSLCGTASTEPQVDLSIEPPGKLQETAPTTESPQTNAAMTRDHPKRPQDSDFEDERPRKRTQHASLDGVSENRKAGSIVRNPSTPLRGPLRFMGRGSPAKAQKGIMSPRQTHDTRQSNRKHPSSRLRKEIVKPINNTTASFKECQGGSSDEPLANKSRGREWGRAHVPTTKAVDDSDEEMPIPPDKLSHRRTQSTSSSDLMFDKPSPQITESKTDLSATVSARSKKDSDTDQQTLRTFQDLKDRLAEASRTVDIYQQKLTKERAKTQDLEQQRLLWEARKLNVQDEQEVAHKQLEAQLRYSEAARIKLSEEIKDHISSNTKLNNDISKLEQKFQNDEKTIKSAHRQAETKAEEFREQVEGLQAKFNEELLKRERLELLAEQHCQQLSEGNGRETSSKVQISELLSSQKQLQHNIDRLEKQFKSKLESSVATRTQQLSKEVSERQATIKQLETHFQSTLDSKVATQTRELRKEIDQRQNTIEQLSQQVEDFQEELDWYKNQLDKERKQFKEVREDWDVREQNIRQFLALL